MATLRTAWTAPVTISAADAEEIGVKEYERDRDGNWLDIIPDGDDHSIDAVRYAMMDGVLHG